MLQNERCIIPNPAKSQIWIKHECVEVQQVITRMQNSAKADFHSEERSKAKHYGKR
jgi:hypothetical protein